MSWFTAELRRYVPSTRGKSYDITTGISTATTSVAGLFDPKHRETLTAVHDRYSGMRESTDLFSSVSQHTDRFLRNPSGYMSSRWEGADIGWRMEEGILGLGNFSAHQPSINGSTSPNLEQFSIGSERFTENLNLVNPHRLDPLLHSLRDWVTDPKKQLEFQKELHDPKKSIEFAMMAADPRKWQSYVEGKLSSDDEATFTEAAEEEEETVKGPGTLRGREATLQLNIGAKGLGRKSLRIGTKGMGKPKTGKYRTHLSGRTSRGYG
jgi:hypothetical protein